MIHSFIFPSWNIFLHHKFQHYLYQKLIYFIRWRILLCGSRSMSWHGGSLRTDVWHARGAFLWRMFSTNLDKMTGWHKEVPTTFCYLWSMIQLMVNWWFGLVVWISGIPLWKGWLLRDTPRIPNHQFTISWCLWREMSNERKGPQIIWVSDKFGMTKVVLRGSWGCHRCKTDTGPP